MTKVSNLFGKKKKENSYDEELARQLIKADPELSRLVDSLDLDVDTLAVWMADIKGFSEELSHLIYRYTANQDRQEVFNGFLSKVLADAARGRLASVAANLEIPERTFLNFQKNAINSILSVSREAESVEDLDAFQGEEDE